MMAIPLIAILVTMMLALTRALLGPTVFDRMLAANMFSTKTILFIAVIGFLTGRPAFLDLALLYALLNFVGVVAILKFVRVSGSDLSELSVDRTWEQST